MTSLEKQEQIVLRAVHDNDLRQIEAALEGGFDIDQVFCKTTLLIEAICTGHTDLMHKLIQAGADVDLGNDEFVTPLCAAAAKNNLTMVEILLRHKCKPYKRAKPGLRYKARTPLHYAISHCNVSMAQLLLEKGHDVNAPTLGDIHPLHEALMIDNADLVRLILNHPKFSLPCGIRLWRNPVYHPVLMREDLSVARAFVESNKMHLFQQKSGNPLLVDLLVFTPGIARKLDVAKLLVYYGADIMVVNHFKHSVYFLWLDCNNSFGPLGVRMPIVFFLHHIGLRLSQVEMDRLQKQCTSEEDLEDVKMLRKICSVPFRLEKLSQLKIRYSLGLQCLRTAQSLPLPTALCDYVATHGVKLLQEDPIARIFKGDVIRRG